MVRNYQNVHCSLENKFMAWFIIIFGTFLFKLYPRLCSIYSQFAEFCSSPLPRSPGSYISRLLERLPRTSQTTVAFCRTLVVAHCGPTPMTCGSCLCHEQVTNSVIGVSRPPVLDCGTTSHLDYGGRDLPSTPSDNLWKLIDLATEALSDSFELVCLNNAYGNILWTLQ